MLPEAWSVWWIPLGSGVALAAGVFLFGAVIRSYHRAPDPPLWPPRERGEAE
jgi:hypothetical protein